MSDRVKLGLRGLSRLSRLCVSVIVIYGLLAVATLLLRDNGLVTQSSAGWSLLALGAATIATYVLFVRSYLSDVKLKTSMLGRCGGCGYDLRASPDRCPECGTPVAK